MTILDQIIADKRVEVERRKLSTSLTELQSTDLYQRECISLKSLFVNRQVSSLNLKGSRHPKELSGNKR